MRAVITACLFLMLPVAVTAADDDATFFTQKVEPILSTNCYSCHGPKKQKHGLRLDSLAALLKGGRKGPAAVAGDPDQSLIIQAVRYQDDDMAMPPKQQLSADQVAILVDWVKRGLPWPQDAAASATGAAAATPAAAAP